MISYLYHPSAIASATEPSDALFAAAEIAAYIEDKLVVTLSNKGCQYKGKLFPVEKVQIKDVSGAGDTFLAALAYQYLITNDIESAVEFATHAASITVQHVGVYAPTLEEIQ